MKIPKQTGETIHETRGNVSVQQILEFDNVKFHGTSLRRLSNSTTFLIYIASQQLHRCTGIELMMFYVTLTHNETFGVSFLKSTLEIWNGSGTKKAGF